MRVVKWMWPFWTSLRPLIGLVTQFYYKNFVASESLALSCNGVRIFLFNDSKEWSWKVSHHLGLESLLVVHKALSWVHFSLSFSYVISQRLYSLEIASPSTQMTVKVQESLILLQIKICSRRTWITCIDGAYATLWILT